MVAGGPGVLIDLWVLGKLDELGKLPAGPFAGLLELGGLGLVSFCLYRTGSNWYKQGKRRSAPSAESLMSRDPRPPVLYLRSFRTILLRRKASYSTAAVGHRGCSL
jgi:hypothetical protein